MEFSTASLLILLKIIAIDIVLSGDNAVVIAMATRRLEKHQQNKAILLGTGGAVLLRIIFAIIIVYLLKVPFVHLIGGVLLLYIAYHVLVGDDSDTEIKSSNSLSKAIGTIILADALMSLDNVVAVAGAAKGHVGMLIIGVAISIPIMIFGSKMIVKVMDKFSWIAYVGSGILAWTAAGMILEDKLVVDTLHLNSNVEIYSLSAIVTIAVLVIGYLRNRRIN
ncbi:TerC family protein [Tigheibacillus jepli]|uniref:TerC family protein n=1 Tax=Tigheibacillus jepli TaxID=3035914 RepID=UPI00387E048A